MTLARRFKERRLFLGLKQSTLAERSGVSLGSLHRFETSGLISLQSLLDLAFTLNCLDEFNTLLKNKPLHSIDDLEQADKKPQEGDCEKA